VADTITVITLPQQPANGTVTFEAMGGNGLTAPKGAYFIRNVQATADNSGVGANGVEVRMDPTYTYLIQDSSAFLSQTTPANQHFVWLHTGLGVPSQGRRLLANVTSVQITAATLADFWSPPASINRPPGTFSVLTRSLGTDIFTFNMTIFLFDIRAREQVPYGDLIAAATGGAGSNSGQT